MKTQRLLIVLTAVNLGLLCYQVMQPRLAVASTVSSPGFSAGALSKSSMIGEGFEQASLCFLRTPKSFGRASHIPKRRYCV